MTGWPRADKPSGKITLILDQPSTLDPDDDLRDGLSAIVRQGDHLWVANDETTSLERLTIEGDQARGHRSFDLTGFLELPGEGRSISKISMLRATPCGCSGRTARSASGSRTNTTLTRLGKPWRQSRSANVGGCWPGSRPEHSLTRLAAGTVSSSAPLCSALVEAAATGASWICCPMTHTLKASYGHIRSRARTGVYY
jgi:hypothetical protein